MSDDFSTEVRHAPDRDARRGAVDPLRQCPFATCDEPVPPAGVSEAHLEEHVREYGPAVTASVLAATWRRWQRGILLGRTLDVCELSPSIHYPIIRALSAAGRPLSLPEIGTRVRLRLTTIDAAVIDLRDRGVVAVDRRGRARLLGGASR